VRGANVPTAMVSRVGLNYFDTLGIPLLKGRDFGEQDDKGKPRVVIVNETFARHFFPGPNPLEDAVGKRVSFNSIEGPFMQIIGVVKDGKYFNIAEEPRPFIYSSLLQSYGSTTILIARTNSDPKTMIAAIRSEVQKLDEHLPIFDVKTMTEHMKLSLFPTRIAAAMLGGFGLLALTLAAIGIYGVMSYSVAQRTREVGIRMALGAQAGDVLRLVVRQGMILVTIGVGIGLGAAFLLTSLMSSLLFGIGPTDPLTFIVIPLILTGVTLGACFMPARRATRVDPMIALRHE
jgi:putative ABC transport system permease protein